MVGKIAFVVSVATLFGVLFLYLPKVLSSSGRQPSEVKPVGKEFDRRLAEGVHAVQPWSGQTVSFRACRVTKPKMGGFRLGAFNVLEIDELEITLPYPADDAESGSAVGDSVTEPVRRSLDAGRLSAVAGLDQRVSMISIRGFKLFMTSRDQQHIPVIIAETAKSSGAASISMQQCELLTEQLTRIQVHKAKLCIGKPVLIDAAGLKVNLDNLAAILKGKEMD